MLTPSMSRLCKCGLGGCNAQSVLLVQLVEVKNIKINLSRFVVKKLFWMSLKKKAVTKAIYITGHYTKFGIAQYYYVH